MTTTQCSATVYTPGMFRGGMWFCTIHDPERVKTKDAERRAKWDRKAAIRQASWDVDAAERQLVATVLLPIPDTYMPANILSAKRRVVDARAKLASLQDPS